MPEIERRLRSASGNHRRDFPDFRQFPDSVLCSRILREQRAANLGLTGLVFKSRKAFQNINFTQEMQAAPIPRTIPVRQVNKASVNRSFNRRSPFFSGSRLRDVSRQSWSGCVSTNRPD